MAWKSYRDMIAWQKAMDLTDDIYRLVALLPKEERYGLADQMRRAAVSVPSNIAEGQGRLTSKEFRQFLGIARASIYELETQLLIGVRQAFFSETQVEPSLSLCDEIGKMLTKLITSY